MHHPKGFRAAAVLLALSAVGLAASGTVPSLASASAAATSSPAAFTPGLPWADANGHLIQGHNGSILKPHGSSLYYWVGQNLANSGKRQAAACYQSADLVHWAPVRGFSLSVAALTQPSPGYYLIGATKIIEASPSQFVIWVSMKIKERNGKIKPGGGLVDVATSSSPCGGYKWRGQDGHNPAPWQPFNHPVGDIGLFQDTTHGPGTGTAYLLSADAGGNHCTSRNRGCIQPPTKHRAPKACAAREKNCVYEAGVRIFQLQTGDARIQGRSSVFDFRQPDGSGLEAPAMFKNGRTYYVLMSETTGWKANENWYSASSSPTRRWSPLRPIYVPASSADGLTCDSQTMWVLPVQGSGLTHTHTTYIYMGDRWDSSHISDGDVGADSLGDSSYVWLPLRFTDGKSISKSGRVPALDCSIHNWSLSTSSGNWVNLGPHFTDALFTFTNVGSGQVIEADRAGKAHPAFPAVSNGQTRQHWRIIAAPYAPGPGHESYKPRYEIRNPSSGLALQDDGGTLDQNSTGTRCAADGPGATNQLWQFVSVNNGRGLMLKNICTGRVAEVKADGTSLGTGAADKAPATSQQWALTEIPSYWAYTRDGKVYNQDGAPWFGALGKVKPRITDIVGLAATPDGEGYWIVQSSGTVWNFGDAAPVRTTMRTSCPGGIRGVAADPLGGFYAFTACGDVYSEAGAAGHGSLASPSASVTGLAATPDGTGYWLVESNGAVSAFPPSIGSVHTISTTCSGGIRGVAADPSGGFYAFTACGNVYNEAGANLYKSLATAKKPAADVVGLATTPDGKGYWLIESDGKVFRFGDASSGTNTAPGVIGAASNPNM